MSYYGKLEWLQRAAKMLQGCPVPNDDTIQDDTREAMLQAALDHAVTDMMLMLRMVRPYVSLWVGKDNDSLRKGQPLAKEWDEIIKGVQE